MFALFSGRHMGGVRRSTNMASQYKTLNVCAEHFDEYLNFGTTHAPQTWKTVFLIRRLSHHNFLTIFTEWHLIVFFYCLTMNTLYMNIAKDNSFTPLPKQRMTSARDKGHLTFNPQSLESLFRRACSPSVGFSISFYGG